jgi:hypothetical protein
VLGRFRLEALGPEHNERDYAAWMSSIDHVRRTPGFDPAQWSGDGWPFPMSIDDNLADLVQHLAEFDAGEAFAYSVLAHPSDDIVGCVYIDPDPTSSADVVVRSWVTVSAAADDDVVATTIDEWVRSEWPAATVRWPGRDHLSH